MLRDEEKRHVYDKFGKEAVQGNGGPQVDPFDIFNNIFGGGMPGMPGMNVRMGGMPFGMHQNMRRESSDIVTRVMVTLEEVFTGTTNNRDSLNHLKQLVLDKKVDTVVVMKLDRLMRNFSNGVIFIKFLLDNNVKIISTTEDVNSDTTSGRFFINMLLSLSELERDTIIDRFTDGKLNKFENHQRHSGRISFGYLKKENNLIVDKSNSEIVYFIFKKYSQLMKQDLSKRQRMSKLLKSLKKKNYKDRDKEFTSQRVHQILKNEFYIGKLKYKDKVTNHNYDTFISKRLFNLVNV